MTIIRKCMRNHTSSPTTQQTMATLRIPLSITLLLGTLIASSPGRASTPIHSGAKPSSTLNHCAMTTVERIDFGTMASRPASIAPQQQTREVFLALRNGIELQIQENVADPTFYGNYTFNHKVEVCPTHQTSQPHFTITDQITGSSNEATLRQQPWPQP